MKILANIFFCFFISITCYSQIKDCQDCNVRLLNKDDIAGKSLEELALLRNEIYARKGYIFQSASKYDRYFSSQKWYRSINNNKDIQLSKIETQNIDFLKNKEKEIQQRRDVALQDMKTLKDAVLNNNTDIIYRYMASLSKEEAEYKSDLKSDLQEIFEKLDIEDIHWNKGRGLYAVTIDNGYYIKRYSIYFEENTICLEKNKPMAHSEIFENFGDGYSDYMSEDEFSMRFVFEMTDTGIVYKYLAMAG